LAATTLSPVDGGDEEGELVLDVGALQGLGHRNLIARRIPSRLGLNGVEGVITGLL